MCTGVKTVTKHEGFYLCLFWIVFCVVIILTHIYPLLPKMEPSCSLGKLGQAVFEALQVLAIRAPGSQGRWAVLKRHLPKPQAPQASILKAWHFTTVTNWFRWGKKKSRTDEILFLASRTLRSVSASNLTDYSSFSVSLCGCFCGLPLLKRNTQTRGQQLAC